MKKYSIEYNSEFIPTPMSFWVHKQIDSEIWREASTYEPEVPKAIPLRGFPLMVVNFQKVELNFASVYELQHFIEVISQKNMPTSSSLSAKRGEDYGPNRHWLSRLPKEIMPWSKRVKMIPILSEALVEFRKL